MNKAKRELEMNGDAARTNREAIRCDLCGEDMFEPVCEEAGYTIGVCRSCSMYYIRELPAQEHHSEIITEAYQTSEEVAARDEFFRYIAFRKQECEEYIRIIGQFVRPGKILDIGCGIGAFLWFAKAAGWEAEGIELNPLRARMAQSMRIGQIHARPLEECRLAAGSYDAITMINVFSHFRSPKKILAHAMGLLKPSGILFVLTAEIMDKPRRCDLPSWGWGVPHHLFWNSGKTLGRYADEINARILYKKSAPFQEQLLRNMFLYRSNHPVKNLVKAIAGKIPFLTEAFIGYKTWTHRHNPFRDCIIVLQKK